MDVGFSYFPTHNSLFPGELARSIEERGHESLFFAEHTHIPASRLTPYPEGKRLPRRYSHTMDLFVAMTAAAVATKRLRIGSSICLIVERDPIITAKQVASIDVLSGDEWSSVSVRDGTARRWRTTARILGPVWRSWRSGSQL